MEDEYKAWREQISRRAEAMEAASIESGNLALKALFLLNGGACVAVLGFLASTFSIEAAGDRQNLIADFLSALKWFAFGSGASVFASCLAYLTNSTYARSLMDLDSRSAWRWGASLNWLAVFVALGSFVLFCCGIFSIRQVYDGLPLLTLPT